MEEIYVIRLKTRPSPWRLYPSERRYSASTVGGLGAVHFLLAAILIFLGLLNRFLESNKDHFYGGLWLGCVAVITGLFGIIAWKRWYVDSQITWFFYVSLTSAFSALLCIALTSTAIAGGVDYPVEERKVKVIEIKTIITKDEQSTDRVESLFNNDDVYETNYIGINIIIAAILDFLWCILSMHVAWKGMMASPSGENDVCNGLNANVLTSNVSKSKTSRSARAPDILSHLSVPIIQCNGSVTRINPLLRHGHVMNNNKSMLPAESATEYHERVQRFLSNAADAVNSEPEHEHSATATVEMNSLESCIDQESANL